MIQINLAYILLEVLSIICLALSIHIFRKRDFCTDFTRYARWSYLILSSILFVIVTLCFLGIVK